MLIPRHQILRWTIRGSNRDAPSQDSSVPTSQFPRLRLPRQGRKIFFWTTQSEDHVEPDKPGRLDTIEINLNCLRLEYEHLSDLVRQTSCATTLKTIHASLTRLLSTLEEQDSDLSAHLNDIAAQPARKLSAWRVTEREILQSEVAALRSDLDTLYQTVRRAHVDLAGVLLEMR